MSADDPQGLEDEWARIVREHDRDSAGEFLADGFILSSEGGVAPTMAREEWLEALPAIETGSLNTSDVEARRFGDVLVVRARLHWDARISDRDLTGDYAVVDVFTRAAGRWQASWRVSMRQSGG